MKMSTFSKRRKGPYCQICTGIKTKSGRKRKKCINFSLSSPLWETINSRNSVNHGSETLKIYSSHVVLFCTISKGGYWFNFMRMGFLEKHLELIISFSSIMVF